MVSSVVMQTIDFCLAKPSRAQDFMLFCFFLLSISFFFAPAAFPFSPPVTQTSFHNDTTMPDISVALQSQKRTGWSSARSELASNELNVLGQPYTPGEPGAPNQLNVPSQPSAPDQSGTPGESNSPGKVSAGEPARSAAAPVVVKNDPMKAQQLYEKAMSLRAAGQMTEAILALREILRDHELTPIAKRASYSLAIAYDECGQPENALEILDATYRNSEPMDDLPRYFKILTKAGKIDKHMEEAARLAEQFKTTYYYVHHYIELCDYLGDQARLIAFLKKGIEEQKNNSYYIETLSNAYLEHGSFKEAEGLLEDLLRLNPSNGKYLEDLGNAVWGQGRTDEARLKWRKIVTNLPLSDSSYLELARVLTEKRLFEEALAALDEGASRIGAIEPFLLEKAKIFERMGDWEKASNTYIDYMSRLDTGFETVEQSFITILKDAPEALPSITSTLEKRLSTISTTDRRRIENMQRLLFQIYLGVGKASEALELVKKDFASTGQTLSLLEFGNTAEKMGFYKEALDAFTLLASKDGKQTDTREVQVDVHVDALIASARMRLALSDGDGALKDLEKARDLSPAAFQKVAILNMMSDIDLSIKKDFSASFECASLSVALMPSGNPAGRLMLGLASFSLDKRTEAISLFESLVDSGDPSVQAKSAAQYYALLGRIIEGDTAECELAFKRILGESAQTLFATKAIELLKIMKTSPFENIQKYALGLMYFECGLTEKASTVFNDLISSVETLNASGKGTELIQYAILARAAALKLSGAETDALKELLSFEKAFPDSRLMPSVLLLESEMRLGKSDRSPGERSGDASKVAGIDEVKPDEMKAAHESLRKLIIAYPEAALSNHSKEMIRESGGEVK
jgi:tetratricopeptide (TPR) repeat protein